MLLVDNENNDWEVIKSEEIIKNIYHHHQLPLIACKRLILRTNQFLSLSLSLSLSTTNGTNARNATDALHVSENNNEFANKYGKHKVLYVAQGEIAMVSTEIFDIVGSDDATSCHIVLAVCKRNNLLIVAHLDTPDSVVGLQKSIDYMTQCNENGIYQSTFINDNHNNHSKYHHDNISGEVELYISGGVKNDISSWKVLISLLQELSQSNKTNCKIQVLNTIDYNSKKIRDDGNDDDEASCYSPIVFGVGFVKELQTCIPLNFADESRGPEFYLRWGFGYNYNNNNNNKDQSWRTSKPFEYNFTQNKPVWDNHSNRFFIKSYHYNFNSNYAASILKKTDKQILSSMSTTPWCEPSRFTNDIRNLMKFLSSDTEIKRAFLNINGNNSNDDDDDANCDVNKGIYFKNISGWKWEREG